MILFASDQEVAELMNAVKRIGATGKFSWIGSDGWSARALVSEGIFSNFSCMFLQGPPTQIDSFQTNIFS